MGLFGPSKTGLIGIDIGADSIKAVELQASGNGFRFVTFGSVKLPPSSISQGEVTNSAEVVSCLKELKKSAKFNSNQVCLGVGGSNVIIRNQTVAYMTREEVDEVIYWEAEQYLPSVDISELNIDYFIRGNPKPEDGQMDLVIVAVKKSHVAAYVDIAKEAGLETKIVDVNAFALENMFNVAYPAQPDQAMILADIGANQINMIVLDGGISVFSRQIDLGASLFTEEIRNQLGVSLEEAEALKIGDASGQEVPVEVQGIISSVGQTFSSEIQRSLDFYLASNSDKPIGGLFLTGGGALTSNLVNIIRERIGFNVEIANPFTRIDHASKKLSQEQLLTVGPIAATAAGLAMRVKE